VEEFQEGCTLEHIGYHLAWICAIFGPATHVTAFSKHLVQHKTDTPLNPPDTPDFSVACLSFADGVAARITCTWVSPRDHRMRIIGEEGEISADNIFHDQSRVRIERFSRLSLAARKAHTLRTRPFLGSLFGIGGRKVQLVRRWKSHAVEAERGVNRTLKHRFVSWLRRREVHALDKLLGVAEMARAISDGCNQPMPPDFHMHINELTLMVHRAGPTGSVMTPTTRFDPMVPPSEVREGVRDYRANYRGGRLQSALAGAVDALHRR
jgi:predicted dehydrogenase